NWTGPKTKPSLPASKQVKFSTTSSPPKTNTKGTPTPYANPAAPPAGGNGTKRSGGWWQSWRNKDGPTPTSPQPKAPTPRIGTSSGPGGAGNIKTTSTGASKSATP